MFSRLSGIANTVLHELSGDGEGSENTRDSDPGQEPGIGEGMSEDQMERLAHYEKLVVQLKDLIQHKDVEIQHKNSELQQKENHIKLEREASEAKFTKLKLQAKAKVTTLNKQIEELKRTAADRTNHDEGEDKNGNAQNESSKGGPNNEDPNSKCQDHNEFTRQLHESQSHISALTERLVESQEAIASLTNQLQDSQESVNELTRSLQEREDAAKELQEKQEFKTCEILRTLEEKNEALHSCNQVMDMLGQELQSAELQKQVLSKQFRDMEQELISLRESLVIEQKESSQHAELYKDLLQEKDVLCQQLQEALEKEKDAANERECLRSQLEKAKLEMDVRPQSDLEQIRGAEEELERLRAELKSEKGAQDELQQLRAELENQKVALEEFQELRELLEVEKDAQEELQQLRAELEKEKGAHEELQQLRAELEKEKGAQEELQQLRAELEKKNGAQEELQQLRAELQKEKGVHEELQQLRELLEGEKGAQEELQQLRTELEKEKGPHEELQQLRKQPEGEKGAQEELQQLRAELQKEKGPHEELQQLRKQPEGEKGAQEELQQLRKLLEKEKGAQDELQQLRAELEKEKGAHEELQQLRAELEKEKGPHEELQQLREQPEGEKGAQKELQQPREKLEKMGAKEQLQQEGAEPEREKGAEEELQQVRSELEQQKEIQTQLHVELERLKKANQELFKANGGEPDTHSRNGLDNNMEIENVKIELEKGNKQHEELSRMKEKLKSMNESLKEFDHVKEEIERGQKILSELEMMKEEIERMREAQSEFNKLQEEQQLLSEQLELTQVEPVWHKKDLQTSVSSADLNTQHYTVTTGEYSDLASTENCHESVASHQILQSRTLNVQTNSLSQELVLDAIVEDANEKQLSILMLDLLDTQEEINKLNGELPVEGSLNKCALSEQAMEKSKDASDEADAASQTHDSSVLKYQNINADKDAEMISMKKMVAELLSQIEILTSEKEQISFKLETLLNSQTTAEKVQPPNEFLELEKQQLTAYESQNILIEQVNSLENESKSKDLKITALQKDLDHMNLLLSEQNELSKVQVNQLEEKEQHLRSLKEIHSLSQNKEVRLSEELATNVRENVLLQELLSQKTTEIQALQESISEKDRQVEEISHSLSDKVVLLNEEKYSMSKEIKELKEQLSSTIQDRNGKDEGQALRAEKTEIHLQFETVTKEKLHLQEMLESVQSRFTELNSHLKSVELKHAQSQEMIKIAQEEREMVQMELQDQKSDLLKKQKEYEELQKEYEELQKQLDTQINYHVQQLQLLTEKQQHSLDVIDSLQGEKSALESQLQSHVNKSQHDAREVGLKESEELHTQLEDHKKENEQLKRKLQAALISRKELNHKISKLEKQMVNWAVNQDKDFTGGVDLEVKSLDEISEQNIPEDGLKQQLCERESDLETVRNELAEKSAANEQFQNLIEELTLKLKDKSRQIESIKTEQTSAESEMSNAEDQEARIQLENRIATLEQDKEILQKKVQEALNSRRDTIKKAQEKDRHHREQLKLQKEEFNLLQENYEKLQLNQKIEVILEERGTQTIKPCLSEKSQNTTSNISEDFISGSFSEENADKSHWGKDWVDISPASIEYPVLDKSSLSDVTDSDYQKQMEVFESHKKELELKTLQLECTLSSHLEEIADMQNTIDQLNRQLQNEKEKNLNLDIYASTLKAELESSNEELSHLNDVTVGSLKEELMQKEEEIGHLHQEIEVVNVALKNANMLLVEKDDVTLSLKTRLEVQAKEYEEHHRKLEMQSLESQSKADEEVEEAKSKQQIQRKLQAALISRKEALKENKTLKLQLDTLMNLKFDLSNRLQLSEGLVNQLSGEKDAFLKTLSAQKEERDKLIAEIDKRLLENQNLEASCKSLKLALAGVTQDKEDLTKELESFKLSLISQISEWQEKRTDLQKEYETLLQSYENVSNETDRMKRAMETVRQEKHESFSKIKSVEAEKKEVEKQLEEAEQEIENMKEKMRKFAKSKQQKILELEEENDRLRGELQPVAGEQKYDTTYAKNSRLKEELDKVHSENHSLTLQLEQVKSEKDTVDQEIESLRLQLHNAESNVQESLKEHISEMHEVIIKNEVEAACSQLLGSEQVIGEQQAHVEMTAKHEINQKQETLEENSQMKELIKKLESHAKIQQNEMEGTNGEIKVLMEEKLSLETQLTNLQSRVTKMETEIVELEKKYQTAIGDLDEVGRQKHASELEKDELEERLMNQMAELNGSIGNFQQDAMDLQVKNDSLQKELENLRLQLEEEKRQLERQKVEALSVAQKEYLEKLKSANQSAKGRTTQSKELQELLKEKQHEVRHLQKDCIQYQESISGLERAIKALEFENNKCEKEKLISNVKLTKSMEDTNKAQNDLASLRVLLDDTQSEAARVIAESMKLKDEVRTITENTTVMLKRKEEDMERRLDVERDKHVKQMVNLQEKINVLQQENEHLKGSIVNLQSRIKEKDQEMKDLQGNLNQNIARLAAFTRSMCSLQNDRDRIIEESKTWSEKFTDAMQKKDIEINDQEKVCTDLQNELLHMTSQLEELKAEVTRLQNENKELFTNRQTEAEVHVKTRDSLLEEKAILSSALGEEQNMHSTCQQELKLRTQEANDWKNQLKALAIEVNQIKSENENLLGSVKSLEAEVQNWKLQSEQIQSDLQASKSLTEQLHKELEQKEQDVVQLLNSRDEAVSTAVGELHDMHAIEFKALQDIFKETERERLEMQDKIEKLTAKLKASQEEVDRSKGQLESFTKSMRSLQEERERVLSDYEQLEQRHLDAILAKDGFIQEAAAESNKLREELRLLRSRTDDLNAQNAKLNAQLTRYRDDLKELISLKDSQLKQLLGEKLQEIDKLRNAQSNQEEQLIQEKGQREILQQELDESKLEKQKMLEEVDGLKLYVSQLLTETGMQGGQLEEMKQETQILKDKLIQVQNELTRVQEESSRIQVEAEQQVQHAEDELNKKLRSMQHDTGILRNETETAEERVAELAKELLESEQRLLTANEEISGLKAQLKAFEGSMRSLQDSHDLAQEEMQRLQEQLMEVSVLNTELSTVNTEKDHLNIILSEGKEQQCKLELQLKDIVKTLQAREEEITRLTSELDVAQTQLQNMSKGIGSLQEDHNGSLATLKAPRMEIERSLQSPSQRQTKVSINEANNSNSVQELQLVDIEVHNLNTQLSDTLKQVHLKELRIQQMNSKLSQIFEEKNTLSLQLRGSNQHLRDATSRCSSLERQLQELQQKNLEVLSSDSAPGAPQEKKEPQMGRGQQLLELQERYLELKLQNTEQEQVRSVLEQQLREERQRSEGRIQELEADVSRLRSLDWSASQESAPHELSLLIETHGSPSVKTRSSSLRRLLRFFFCPRAKAPLLFSVYLLLIHVLLVLCFTGHL